MEAHTPILNFSSESSSPSIKVISLNLLAQHLIEGECVSYQHKNDKAKPEPLKAIRLACLTKFLRQDTVKDFDILNL